MKFIKLNNGRLVNLEHVSNISFWDEKEISVCYSSSGNAEEGWMEIFDSKEEAHVRMKEVQELALQESCGNELAMQLQQILWTLQQMVGMLQ